MRLMAFGGHKTSSMDQNPKTPPRETLHLQLGFLSSPSENNNKTPSLALMACPWRRFVSCACILYLLLPSSRFGRHKAGKNQGKNEAADKKSSLRSFCS